LRKRLRQTLSGVLSSEDLSKVYNSYDVVGDIAIIRLSRSSSANAQIIGKAILSVNQNVKTVLLQTSPVAGDLRLRSLTCVAGENKTNTIHNEHGCVFSVNVEKCYFSPRLSHERMRIAKMIEPGEIVVNMFAGVGCFSIIMAKHANPAKVFSIDVNPKAVQLMRENIRLNRVYDNVIPLFGDSKEIVNNRFLRVAHRVLMPLPERSLDYLPCAASALKPSGGWIHYYSFEHANKNESPCDKLKLKLAGALEALTIDFKVNSVRIVRSTGPNWYQIVADVRVMRWKTQSQTTY
jgi:tRNA (guanine37-N1)-methyltransferase